MSIIFLYWCSKWIGGWFLLLFRCREWTVVAESHDAVGSIDICDIPCSPDADFMVLPKSQSASLCRWYYDGTYRTANSAFSSYHSWLCLSTIRSKNNYYCLFSACIICNSVRCAFKFLWPMRIYNRTDVRGWKYSFFVPLHILNNELSLCIAGLLVNFRLSLAFRELNKCCTNENLMI